MNFRVTIILLVVLAALGGALAFSGQGNEEASQPTAEQEELAVFALKATDIERLDIQRGSESQRFQKQPSGDWTIQPTGEQADQSKVTAAAARLANLRAIRRIPSGEVNLASYGLEKSPRLSVQITLTGGASHQLRVGEQTPVQTGYYAQADQASDVFVLPNLLVADLEQLLDQPYAPTPTATPRATPTPRESPEPTAPSSVGGAPAATPVLPNPGR